MGWFVELKPAVRPRATLFCFPFGGGSAAAFRPWADHVPSDVKLVGIDLPGRAARFGEPLLTSAKDVVTQLLAEKGYFARHAPFVFFGHSLGAIVAFELARELPPSRLVVSGRRAPHLPLPRSPIYDLPDHRFVEELRKYEGTPEEVLADREVMELYLPILKADFAISESYRYEEAPPLALPLLVLGGESDPMVEASSLHEWTRHTTGDHAVHTFEGGHFFLNDFVPDIVKLALGRSS